MYIFVDESGDVGSRKSSSKHFVVALFIPENPKDIRKCFKKIRQRKWKKRYKSVREFKWSASDRNVKKIVLEELAKRSFDVYCIVCVKSKIYDRTGWKKNELQPYLTGTIVENIVSKPEDDKLQLVVDKFLSNRRIEEYNRYIREKIKGVLVTGKEVSIEHMNSQSEPNLQAADMIAGAVFQKYETGDNSYYRIIKGHVKKEDIRWN